MQRLRFLGLAWGVAACVTGSVVEARLAERPVACLRDGYCCPYGLGQWEGRPHRYVYDDHGYDAGGASPAITAPLPIVVDEPHGAVGTQAPSGQFYDDIENSNFDCPYYRQPQAAAEREPVEAGNHPACRGEEPCERHWCEEGAVEEGAAGETTADEDDSAVGLPRTLSVWQHSAGLWIVEHLNAESDGLDETVASEPDWATIADEIERHEAELDVQGPPPDSGACHDGAKREPYEPGRVYEWCGELWTSLRSATLRVAQGFGWLAERMAAPTTVAREHAAETDVETVEPRIETARPPLPDYFLPAFGSPWDGEL